MFRNYVTVAVRNLFRHRLYSAINIFGLAVGLASCILILLYVRNELSYDRWIPDGERIYRVQGRFDVPGRDPFIFTSSPAPALAALRKDFAEIETGARLWLNRPTVTRGSDVFAEEMIVADDTFFEVLDLPLAAGDKATALKDPNTVVLTESMARKYFGAENPMGQVLTASMRIGVKELRVTGVLKDLPENTHLKIDFITPLVRSEYTGPAEEMLTSWTSANMWTYIKLKTGADAAALNGALPAFEERNIPSLTSGGQDFNVADFLTLSLANLRDLYLRPNAEGGLKPPGDITAVYTFSVVAVMILLIACINFTNLATARASQRAREVALRKVLGAHRGQLVAQFIGESVLMAVVALACALAVAALALPAYNAFLGKTLALSFFGADGIAPKLLALIALVGIAGGVYPAFYLSRFMPARILKANKSAAAEGSGRLRSALVVVQFAISIGLMICTAVVYGQTVYAKTMDLGYNREGLMIVRGLRRPEAQPVQDSARQEMAKIFGVTDVTLSDDVPTDQNESNTLVQIPGRDSREPLVIQNKFVDEDFFAAYQVELLAGRLLSRDYGGDDFSGTAAEQAARGGNLLVNRAALPRLGFGSPADAVGKRIRIAVGIGEEDLMADMTVVGVVENFHYRSVRDEMAPALFMWDSTNFGTMTIRYDGVSGATVREAAARVWRELVPSVPFNAEFMDDLVEQQYQSEEAQGTLFAAFAGLAIVIACLGLFGLASFTAARRTKEIGIRKVLGARVGDVVRLLAWDFSKPVLIANLIAWPAAWWLMRDWLNGFQNRIDLDPAVFAAAGAAALMIALVTVAGHAARVARSNPIHALRYE